MLFSFVAALDFRVEFLSVVRSRLGLAPQFVLDNHVSFAIVDRAITNQVESFSLDIRGLVFPQHL